MAERFRPAEAAGVREVVEWALSAATPLAVVGHGSKAGAGRPVDLAHTLDLSALAGIGSYEPDELVLTAAAATPLAEVERIVAQRGQQLAFEPCDWGPLLGGPAEAGTLGGAIACNLSGPRRFRAGAARDHVLGVKAVSGRAEEFKTGGRVVKNVTGYDLCKLLTGSWGTLAVLTEITVKVMPAPEAQTTVAALGLDDGAGVAALTEIAGSALDASGLAHLPAATAARLGAGDLAGAGRSVTAVRIEGPTRSVADRSARALDLLKNRAEIVSLDAAASAPLWRELRDVTPFASDGAAAVWRLSLAPAAGARVVAAIGASREVRCYYDWAGGLIWLATDEAGDGGAAAIRAAVTAHGGHALLVRGSAALRARVQVFPPQAEALQRLSARVKDSFDPQRILNPGRMYDGL